MPADGKPLDVLEDKIARIEFAYQSKEFANQDISRIVESSVSDQRKALARGAANDDIDRSATDTRGISDIVSGDFGYIPANRCRNRKIKLVNACVDGIDFDGCGHVETGLLETEAHSARTCKQIDCDTTSHVGALIVRAGRARSVSAFDARTERGIGSTLREGLAPPSSGIAKSSGRAIQPSLES